MQFKRQFLPLLVVKVARICLGSLINPSWKVFAAAQVIIKSVSKNFICRLKNNSKLNLFQKSLVLFLLTILN